jgi:hypothetical protein
VAVVLAAGLLSLGEDDAPPVVPKAVAAVPIRAPAQVPPPAPAPKRTPAPAPRIARTHVKLTHWTREGTLTLSVDGRTALERSFARGKAPFRTHSWELSVPAGRHRVSARVVGAKGKVFEAEPIEAEFSPDVRRELRLRLGSDLSLR